MVDKEGTKTIYLSVEEATNKIMGWSSTSFEGGIECEIDSNHLFLESKPQTYKYINGIVVSDSDLHLQEAKKLKKREMKKFCEQKILEGFMSSDGHRYRTNRDDQMNMNGQRDELQVDDTITAVYWKTEDVGYIPHTREEWLVVYKEAFQSKKLTLFRYDELKGEIDLLKTVEEVIDFEWYEK